MSRRPKPPGRSLLKYIVCPSREKEAASSLEAVLIVGPRFTGSPQASSRLARCETQMSFRPKPPGRSELKYRLRPSLESAGPASMNPVLMVGPRLTGADHSENVDAAKNLGVANSPDAPSA